MLNPEDRLRSAPLIAVVDDAALARAMIERWAQPADHAYAAARRRGADTLCALAALRALLCVATGQTGWQVERAPHGKPSVRDAQGEAGPAISLAHSRGLVAVAVCAAGAVGIDVERPRKRDFSALAEQAFGPREITEIAAAGGGAFYRIWTLREAMAKATGAGLALALNRHDLAEAVRSDISECRHRAGQDWALFHTASVPGGDLAVAWLGGGGAEIPVFAQLGDVRMGPCGGPLTPPQHCPPA